MNNNPYHLLELQIARDPSDKRWKLPPIPTKCQSILDVGCGAGQTLIASDLPSGVLRVGLDVDPAALSLGATLDPKIRFVCGTGETLPFPDESFDMVVSRVALPYMRPNLALTEMRRVLKRDGELWILLHPLSMVVKELMANISHFQIKAAVHRLYVLANGTSLHFIGKGFTLPFNRRRYESFQTDRSITRGLRQAGFEHIKIERDDFYVVSARKKSAPLISEAVCRTPTPSEVSMGHDLISANPSLRKLSEEASINLKSSRLS
jgi:ubiquinone/menaquinone biosynthesis C-methylase UbiE